MLLTQDQEMIRDAVRAFAQEELWPNAAKWDKEHHFPKAAHKGLAQLGAYGICVPEEYGGANLDYLTLALVLEEIAAGDGGTSTPIAVTNCPYNAILMRYGSAAQKQQWLAPAARGEAAVIQDVRTGKIKKRIALGARSTPATPLSDGKRLVLAYEGKRLGDLAVVDLATYKVTKLAGTRCARPRKRR